MNARKRLERLCKIGNQFRLTPIVDDDFPSYRDEFDHELKLATKEVSLVGMPTYEEIGDRLTDLVQDQSEWSQATFGPDGIRGSSGPLKHLEKEAREAQNNPTDIMEYADCLLLILDASRRAGFTTLQLIQAAQEKMKINRARKWPAVTDMTSPVEHEE